MKDKRRKSKSPIAAAHSLRGSAGGGAHHNKGERGGGKGSGKWGRYPKHKKHENFTGGQDD